MITLDRTSRNGLAVVIAMLIATMLYISQTHSFDDTPHAPSSPLNVMHNLTTNASWMCDCYASQCRSPLPDPPVPELLFSHAESTPLIVPEHLGDPLPDSVQSKITDNLQGRTLITTVASYGMREHLHNWMAALNRTMESKFLVVCLDDRLLTHLEIAGYGQHAILMPESWHIRDVSPPAHQAEYLSPAYLELTHTKSWVVQQLLYMDITVLFSDVDVIWLRPRTREYLQTFPNIRSNTHALFQLEGFDHRRVSGGFFMMRPSDAMKRLMAHTIRLQETAHHEPQQWALNTALDAVNMNLITSNVMLLDALHFPNGYTFFSRNLPASRGVNPYVVHANYLVGEQKKKTMQEHGLWYIDDAWVASMDTERK